MQPDSRLPHVIVFSGAATSASERRGFISPSMSE